MEKFLSHSPQETRVIGRKLAQQLPANRSCLIILVGDLGAGKTQFVQALAGELGVTDTVVSPSYTYIHEYPRGSSGKMLYHLDLWRTSKENFAFLPLEQYLQGDNIVVVEWADKFAVELDHIWQGSGAFTVAVKITELSENQREITVTILKA